MTFNLPNTKTLLRKVQAMLQRPVDDPVPCRPSITNSGYGDMYKAVFVYILQTSCNRLFKPNIILVKHIG
jgi:hypothetical protein